MNILLVCASGLSTGLLVTKMKKESEAGGHNNKIVACSLYDLKSYIDDCDVLLLGPQVRHKSKKIAQIAQEKNKGFAIIDLLSYGLGDGKKMLEQALSLVENSANYGKLSKKRER